VVYIYYVRIYMYLEKVWIQHWDPSPPDPHREDHWHPSEQ